MNPWNEIEQKVKMTIKGSLAFIGGPERAREELEELLFEKLGDVRPSLQEIVTDNSYYVYLDSWGFARMDLEQLRRLKNLGITENPKTTTNAIIDLLGIEINLLQKGY